MGSGRWSASAWSSYSAGHAGRSRSQIFRARQISSELDPKNITVRESRDSDDNPNSTPIVVAVDVTGSMGMLAESLVRRGLKPLFEEIIDREPVSDPHVMAMAIGDAWVDRAPLQVTQFEADLRVARQIEEIYLEGGGGGNGCESYNLPWYFAATRIEADAYVKRRKKGYLFTVGDEPCPAVLEAAHVRGFLGDSGCSEDMRSSDVLAMVERKFNVFHVLVEEGGYAKAWGADRVRRGWSEVLGERVLPLDDHTRLAEVIVSAIEVTEGRDVSAVAGSWSGSTAMTVASAIRDLRSAPDTAGGIVRF